VTLCSDVVGCQLFILPCCLHFQPRRLELTHWCLLYI